MRQKSKEFLKRLQLSRPEVKKTFRRGGANAAGIYQTKNCFFNKILYSI
jgi:hypothetical protein